MLIGISERIDVLEGTKRSYCNYSYIQWIKRQGHNVFIINTLTPISFVVEHCDMLLLNGGYDIHPSFYNGLTIPSYPYYNKELDVLDFTLLKAFYEAKKPVLGICRGLQIINVFFNGTLYSDIKEHMKKEHSLFFHKNALLKNYYIEGYRVNSYHHQAIEVLGDKLQIEAISKDGIIEAISYDTFIIGVQWHPELMNDDVLLSYFSKFQTSICLSNR